MLRRRTAGALIVCALAAAAGPPVATAAGAELRVRDRLIWTRPDGTAVAFRPDVRVWCGRWESGVNVPSIHVRVGSLTVPRWELRAVVADVKRRPVVRLPDSPQGRAALRDGRPQRAQLQHRALPRPHPLSARRMRAATADRVPFQRAGEQRVLRRRDPQRPRLLLGVRVTEHELITAAVLD